MIDGPSDPTVALMQTALDRAARRAALVASNLANVDTPGYRARDLEFPAPVARPGALEPLRTDPAHLVAEGGAAAPGRVAEITPTRVRADGNSVDVDREMTLLAALQGRFQAAAEMIRKRFGMMIYAATDGRNQS